MAPLLPGTLSPCPLQVCHCISPLSNMPPPPPPPALQKHEGQLASSQLISMLHGVASGMKYLTEMGYVHRSLTAHKVLVNGNLLCKISGFRPREGGAVETVFSMLVSVWIRAWLRGVLGNCPPLGGLQEDSPPASH